MLTCLIFCSPPFELCLFSSFPSSGCQVILATIERHKQNSETFNKAFNSSFSREDDHPPESPVSLTLPYSVTSLISQLAGHPVQWIMGDSSKGRCHSLAFVWLNNSPSMDVAVSYRQNTHIKKLFITTCSVCESPRALSWPNRESPSQSLYKTLMDLLWPTLDWLKLDLSQV